jgi:hypothetical protein
MDLKRFVGKAKGFVEEHKDEIKERGAGLKEALPELKDIAHRDGSLKDKAKAAVAAIKDPGAPVDDAPATPPE